MSNYILCKGHDSTKFHYIIITSILRKRNVLGCNFPRQGYFRQAISEILPTKQNFRTPKLCPAAAPNVQFDVIKSKPPFD